MTDSAQERPSRAKVLVVPFRIRGRALEVLLLHRPGADGFWQPVTGNLEGDETVGEAAARELREETGLTGELVELDLVVDFRTRDGAIAREACYAAKVDGDPVLCAEHDAFAWLPADEAMARLRWEGNKAAVYRLALGVAQSEPDAAGTGGTP